MWAREPASQPAPSHRPQLPLLRRSYAVVPGADEPPYGNGGPFDSYGGGMSNAHQLPYGSSSVAAVPSMPSGAGEANGSAGDQPRSPKKART